MKTLKVPDEISTLSMLREWLRKERPQQILLSKNSLLCEIYELSPSNIDRWPTIRGIPVVYEAVKKYRVKAKYRYMFALELRDQLYERKEVKEDGNLGVYDATYYINARGLSLPDLLIWTGGTYEMAEHESVMEESIPENK